jgi:hypothetical protein
MKDLIERQAAIDAIRASTSKYTGFMEMEMYTDDDAVEAIEGLPSVQPDLDEWCPDCKEYDSKRHYCPRFNRVIREALKEAKPRKPGKWTVYDRHTIPYQYVCSSCGAFHRAMYDFCPSCGADMRGEK